MAGNVKSFFKGYTFAFLIILLGPNIEVKYNDYCSNSYKIVKVRADVSYKKNNLYGIKYNYIIKETKKNISWASISYLEEIKSDKVLVLKKIYFANLLFIHLIALQDKAAFQNVGI